MRLDKFLWSVRYYKTRSLAADACKKNRIKVNGEVAKASRDIIPGDEIAVRKDQINFSFRVLQVPENRIGAKLVTLHIIDTTPKEEYEALELRKISQDYYRQKGEGRPTKKDRRDLDDFISGEFSDTEDVL
ncbi:RNA-binding S4 domain-containing protein [Weeksella virosa]|uniref:RNA-binding S4 domain protein n=1 Tax=Weeksella virosa (strain ATCC 43766 / DSM 16922 / JCM 21250 / CCUG 30538 / CDC 9751 / IAM 14551 / NBRC 16016 / NCTC 11634 / CL345/78) TaxID=865938 RepID=F0NZY2_WEEVC|nr:RNA-binding S4 domain-containing protein [Weeksella virosa]ADX68406.1 RNA-binding S4 domain protein [Weeksella virosa DSM 16922]MDK7674628.1 S4 domain-containing protein [Weeksella virosa]SUP54738.1 ribosome-associated heat shock protein Hsp15 [Weeksella virosa]VEH63940.1 ribosome-associated heat shock protein Hsp15 [Weeksella virosa]